MIYVYALMHVRSKMMADLITGECGCNISTKFKALKKE